MLIRVELSLSVSRAAEKAASGPEVKAMTAACGRYATVNMSTVTPMLSVRVDGSRLRSGFHSARCVAKYTMP